MSNQLEDNKNALTKPTWKQQSKVTTDNSVSNDFYATSTEKTNDLKTTTPQVIQKGGDDFWMPAVNTKPKHSNPIKIMQNPNQSLQQQQQHSIEPQQCNNDGTQLLKSLLGLSANQAQVMPVPAAAAKVCFTFHNLYNINLMLYLLLQPQLPQPPTSWRTDAQKVPPIPHNFPRMPLPQNPYNNAPLALIGGNLVPLPTSQQQQVMSQYQQQPHVSIFLLFYSRHFKVCMCFRCNCHKEIPYLISQPIIHKCHNSKI